MNNNEINTNEQVNQPVVQVAPTAPEVQVSQIPAEAPQKKGSNNVLLIIILLIILLAGAGCAYYFLIVKQQKTDTNNTTTITSLTTENITTTTNATIDEDVIKIKEQLLQSIDNKSGIKKKFYDENANNISNMILYNNGELYAEIKCYYHGNEEKFGYLLLSKNASDFETFDTEGIDYLYKDETGNYYYVDQHEINDKLFYNQSHVIPEKVAYKIGDTTPIKDCVWMGDGTNHHYTFIDEKGRAVSKKGELYYYVPEDEKYGKHHITQTVFGNDVYEMKLLKTEKKRNNTMAFYFQILKNNTIVVESFEVYDPERDTNDNLGPYCYDENGNIDFVKCQEEYKYKDE